MPKTIDISLSKKEVSVLKEALKLYIITDAQPSFRQRTMDEHLDALVSAARKHTAGIQVAEGIKIKLNQIAR